MIAHRIDAKLTEDQVLLLRDPPFRAGDSVEVIVLEKQDADLSDTEDAHFAEWKMASYRTLQEVWDNSEDAAYDGL